MTLIDEIIAVAGVLFFAVCLIWEPVQTFWTKHTWREEQGLYVRDYAPLREWACDTVRVLFLLALNVGVIWLLYPWL